MQALVLVGGEGTRLRPLTSTLPKPIVPLVDRPFLIYMIDWLVHHGIEDIVLSCGTRSDSLRAVLGEGDGLGPRIRYAEEPHPLGTAGAIKFAERFLEDRFLVLNGDVLTDLDLRSLIRQHEETAATATLGLYPVRDPSRYGLVRRTASGEITEFLEKPSVDQIDTDEISAGMYVLEHSVLEMVPSDQEFSIERQVFPRLVGDGLYGRRLEGYWLDIGTPETYLQATWDILERRVQTEIGAGLGRDFRLVEDEAHVDADALIVPPVVLREGAHIAAGARVGPLAVVGHGSVVESGAQIERAVLHRGCRIGERVLVRDSIIASGAELCTESSAERGTILGEGVRVGTRNQLQNGILIFPGVDIPDEAIRFQPPEQRG